MAGPLPKEPRLAQRRHRPTTAANVAADARVSVAPPLPQPPAGSATWHPRVAAWWASIWASPVATLWSDTDVHGLEIIAALRQSLVLEANAQARLRLADGVRRHEARFGLDVASRRSLRWEVAAADGAGVRSTRPRPDPDADPRELLRAVP